MCLDATPRLSHDLLQDDPDVVSTTGALFDESTARAQSVRQEARAAVLAIQDDKSLRRALAARPRAERQYCSGDRVAYWRKGKGKGLKMGNARWHGRAVLIGQQGRNWIVSHRNELHC